MPARKQLWEKRMDENCTPAYVDAFPPRGAPYQQTSCTIPCKPAWQPFWALYTKHQFYFIVNQKVLSWNIQQKLRPLSKIS